MKKYLFLIIVAASFMGQAVYAQPNYPPGVDLSFDRIFSLSETLAGFLMLFGGILVAITIISSGIMYYMSGGDPQKVGMAKSILKAGILGALIIFGTGMIIATIRGFVEDPMRFFTP